MLLSMGSGKKHCAWQIFCGGNFYGDIKIFYLFHLSMLVCSHCWLIRSYSGLYNSWQICSWVNSYKSFPLKDFTMYAWYIPSTKLLCCTGFLNPLFIIASVTEWDMGQAQFLIYFLKPSKASTEPLNEAQPSIYNLLANTETLPTNSEATKSSNGAQLSINNLQANTETISST